MRVPLLAALLSCFALTACMGGGADTQTLDAPDAAQTAPAQTASAATVDKIEIPVGTPEARVLQLLGPADAVESGGDGRTLWRYTGKRTEYVYVSNATNVPVLIIGKYEREPNEKSLGLPLMLTLVFDPARKIVDFNFAQISY